MKKTITLCCTLTALAGLTTTDAAASDEKSYHASQCQSIDGIETDYNRSEYRITRVDDAGSGNLMCPVVRDVFECGGWLGCVQGATATVKVYDRDINGQVTCSFSSRNETGSSVYYSTDASSLGLAPGHDTLEMGGGYPTGDGTYSLRCQMPVNTRSSYTKIFGYHVSEGN